MRISPLRNYLNTVAAGLKLLKELFGTIRVYLLFNQGASPK